MSLFGRAREAGLITTDVVSVREFAKDRHRKADDTPYGGGEGMVLRADVLHAAWKHALESSRKQSRSRMTILLSPQGELLTQSRAKKLAKMKHLVMVCGHYEGVDERFVEKCVDLELSIGDYVLTGGELAALVVADTVSRLIPGVVGNPRSLTEETFEKGLLKYPQYTRPRVFEGLEVPEVLLSGHHGHIGSWRASERLKRTQERRPQLLNEYRKSRKSS